MTLSTAAAIHSSMTRPFSGQSSAPRQSASSLPMRLVPSHERPSRYSLTGWNLWLSAHAVFASLILSFPVMPYVRSMYSLSCELSESLHLVASLLHGSPPYTLTHMLNSSNLILPLSSGSFSITVSAFSAVLSTFPFFATVRLAIQSSDPPPSPSVRMSAKSSSTLLRASLTAVILVSWSSAANSVMRW